MHKDIAEIAFSEETIKARVRELGKEITRDFDGQDIVLIGILTGSFIFLADLAREIKLNAEIKFLKASSYGMAAVSSGTVDIAKELNVEIESRHILIVEDIIDSGKTMERILGFLKEKKPASVKNCSFLVKTETYDSNITVDYAGFECGSHFFVGYGLDYAEQYRSLPYIGILKPEIYTKK